MLIRITDHCKMACNHCLVNATPKGQHMPMNLFIQAVALANKLNIKVLIISGGEPTDHPLYVDFMHYLTFNFHGVVTVTSHGDFIEDEEACQRYFGQFPAVAYQITNDNRYYPKELNRARAAIIEKQYPFVIFVWKIGGELFPQGRARRHLKITEENALGKASKCFNLRSLVHNPNIGSLYAAIKELESRGRFCTPSININGSLSMGESNECPETAQVGQELQALTNAIKGSQCNDCGMLSSLDPLYKEAIHFKG